jgi:hypothetical protein
LAWAQYNRRGGEKHVGSAQCGGESGNITGIADKRSKRN